MATRIFNDFKHPFCAIWFLFFIYFFFEELSFCLGNLFNLEGNFILETNEEIYFPIRSLCGCFYYFDFKKIFTPVKIREVYDGIKILESENS